MLETALEAKHLPDNVKRAWDKPVSKKNKPVSGRTQRRRAHRTALERMRAAGELSEYRADADDPRLTRKSERSEDGD
jgi:hypothetical protein